MKPKGRKKTEERQDRKRPLQLKDEGTEYGQIVRMLGAGRVEAKTFHDGRVRNCGICGRMRKKVWVSVGDIVLVGLRDFQDEKADIVHKYTPDEARQLKTSGVLPSGVRVNEARVDDGSDGEGAGEGGSDDDFDFEAI
jgi:translation initiation factor 1A